MSKLKDFFNGAREGASRGFEIGFVAGLGMIFVKKDKLPQNDFIQGVLKPVPLETSRGLNIGSLFATIGIIGTIGAIIGGIYGLVSGEKKEKQEAMPQASDGKDNQFSQTQPQQFSTGNPSLSQKSFSEEIRPRDAVSHVSSLASQRIEEKSSVRQP